MEVDLLAFGAHPDDVEIGAGGILAAHAAKGYKCGIIDLTAGEMGSNGTVEERRAEAQKAAEILGCPVRQCLGLPDTGLTLNTESLYEIVKAMRKFKPKVVLAPYFEGDRHSDHSMTGELVKRAAFLSGLKRLPLEGKPFRPEKIYFFLLTTERAPDLIVDITAVYEIKEEAVNAHRTQFSLQGGEREPTLVNNPFFLRLIRSRDSYFGSLIKVSWGEGLVLYEKPRVLDLMQWGGV